MRPSRLEERSTCPITGGTGTQAMNTPGTTTRKASILKSINNFTATGVPESAEKTPHQVLFHHSTTSKNEAAFKTHQKLVEDPLGLLSENEDVGPKTTAQKKKEITICLELEKDDD